MAGDFQQIRKIEYYLPTLYKEKPEGPITDFLVFHLNAKRN